MGNVDDAVSITVAVLIVLTGAPLLLIKQADLNDSVRQWASCKNEDQKRVLKR